MLTNSRDIIDRLMRDGFVYRTTRGSHHKYAHPTSQRVVIVPHPKRDIPIGTVRSICRRAGDRTRLMPHYIAVIHKEPASCYGVSFPDVPGVITAADSLDAAIQQAADVLAFAAEDWEEATGAAFPTPRTLDQLRSDVEFVAASTDAVVAAIPFSDTFRRAA